MDRILSCQSSTNPGRLVSVTARYVWVNGETREVRIGDGEGLHQPSPDEIACAFQLPGVAGIQAELAGEKGAALADLGQQRAALTAFERKLEVDGRALTERTAAVANLEAEQRRKADERERELAQREAAAVRREREAESVVKEYDKRLAAAETARAEAIAEKQGLLRIMAAAGQPVSA